jgi:serine/threonine protein kinase
VPSVPDLLELFLYDSLLSISVCMVQHIRSTTAARPSCSRKTKQDSTRGWWSVVASMADRVGEYTLSETLGVGSFGRVVLGMHRRTAARVAIKILPKDAANECAIKRVSTEISTMEKTGRECPFVVQLLEVLIGRSNIYLVMEYGGSELFPAVFKLASDVESDVGSPLRETRARTYFQQLVMGVQWCHKMGVAHRDLKPANLLLDDNAVLKIADFGFAAMLNLDSGQPERRSMRKTMCGSPLYMAPELLSLREGCAYDSLATDAWGCGAVLYAMVLGTPPFPADSFSELVELALHPRANLKIPDRMHRELGKLLRAMLRLDSKKRFTLRQVARSSWFQTDLARTLSRTPTFRSPFEPKRTNKRTASSESSFAEVRADAGLLASSERTSPSQVLLSVGDAAALRQRGSWLNMRNGAMPMRTQTHTVMVSSLGPQAIKQISEQDESTAACPALTMETRRVSSVQIVSDDLREAAAGLANRLRRLVRATRSTGLAETST